MEVEKVKPSAFIVQTLSTVAIAYLVGLTGFIYAWPSYTVQNFMSNATVLDAPMSELQVSLLGSVTNVGGLLATPLCGLAVNNVGRKYSAMLFGLPYVLCWLMIALSRSPGVVILAMAVGGAGAAGQVGCAVYICELAQDAVRGALTSTVVSGFFVGLLLSYALGARLPYLHVVYVHLALATLYLLLLMCLRESPVYLMQKEKEQEAAKSIAFYRRVSVTSKEVQLEISKIKLQLDPHIDEILAGAQDPETEAELLQKTLSEEATRAPVSSWTFLRRSASSRRALGVSLTVMALTILMGPIVLQVFAEPLLQAAAPSLPSALAAQLMAVAFLLASLLCGAVVDRCGRKSLLTYSSLASGVCNLALGLQLQLQLAPHWVTALIIYVYCFIYNTGAAVVPFILTAEIFLPEVRALCNSLTMGCMWLMNFATLLVFYPLVARVGLGAVFLGFAAVSAATAVFSHLCLPETKGLSPADIQPLFDRRLRRRESTR